MRGIIAQLADAQQLSSGSLSALFFHPDGAVKDLLSNLPRSVILRSLESIRELNIKFSKFQSLIPFDRTMDSSRSPEYIESLLSVSLGKTKSPISVFRATVTPSLYSHVLRFLMIPSVRKQCEGYLLKDSEDLTLPSLSVNRIQAIRHTQSRFLPSTELMIMIGLN